MGGGAGGCLNPFYSHETSPLILIQSNKNLKGCLLITKNILQLENGSLGFIETLHKQL